MVHQGWQAMGVYGPVYSFVALQILSRLVRQLAAGPYPYPLRVWIAGNEPALAISPETVPYVREGKMFSPKARCVLVSMAYWLMEEWPARFVAAARAVGMSSRDLCTHYDRRAHTFMSAICIATAVIFCLNQSVLSLAQKSG